MADARRVAKLNSMIYRELNQLFTRDARLQQAVSPKKRKGADLMMGAFASVTEVRISRDLDVAKVFVSIYGSDKDVERGFGNLQKLEPYIRKQVGRFLTTRRTPQASSCWTTRWSGEPASSACCKMRVSRSPWQDKRYRLQCCPQFCLEVSIVLKPASARLQSGFDYGVRERSEVMDRDFVEYDDVDDEDFEGFDVGELNLPADFLDDADTAELDEKLPGSGKEKP
eukprot:scaffold1594_cov401-Prasinococcus_capsulatus_cf.AAC.18